MRTHVLQMERNNRKNFVMNLQHYDIELKGICKFCSVLKNSVKMKMP